MRSANLVTFGLLLCLLSPHAANAQPTPTTGNTQPTAADKSVARTAASEGIELYRQQRYAAALERLQQAQALYDAPVHLLYIARCQRDTQQWVEAAETYRGLSRRQLPPDAPEAFRNAVKDAGVELAELQPKIPRLVIKVSPSDAPELQLSVDEQPASLAVLGLERPQNPGNATLRVSAKGYKPTQLTVPVAEGQVVPVDVQLERLPEPAVTATPVAAKPAAVSPAASEPSVAILLGLRLGVASPAGSLPGVAAHPFYEQNVAFDKFAQGGGELELHAGVHFLRRLALLVYLDLHGLRAAENTNFVAPVGRLGTEVRSTPSDPGVASLGVAVQGGPRRGQSGPFAGLGFAFVHALAYDLQASAENILAVDCKSAVTTAGTAARIEAGWVFPIKNSAFQISPYLSWTLGGARSVKYKPGEGCSDYLDGNNFEPANSPLHSLLGLGVAGEVLFGR